MTEIDRRTHAYRDDVADIRLKGYVASERFVKGSPRQVVAPVSSLRKEPRFDAMQLSEVLLGESLLLYAEEEGWAFVQMEADGYVGYVAADDLREVAPAPTHKVVVPSTFSYPTPSIKTQPTVQLPMLAAVSVVSDDGKFARLADGRFVYARHLAPLSHREPDFVAVAERFLHVPYYWGGKTVRGLDCSGLVQIALQACGRDCPRDSDMQEERLGTRLPIDHLDGLRRGDLVFWKGHVGLMTDAETLLHANGTDMLVIKEPLRAAVARISAAGSAITSLKRLQ
jgi:cell wall-associated NlpC family hydrolase